MEFEGTANEIFFFLIFLLLCFFFPMSFIMDWK